MKTTRHTVIGCATLLGLLLCAHALLAETDMTFNCVSSSHYADGTLHIDSSGETHEFGWRRYALDAGSRLFAPNGRYQLSFRCKVDGNGSKAHLLVLVRPASVPTAAKDALSLSVMPTHGEWKTYSVAVDASDEPDYRLQFHSWNRIKAEIADICIVERPPLAFRPATPDAPRYSGEIGSLPTGAKEFDVDLPQKGSGIVLNAADFGVSEANPDNTAALRKAFAAAKQQKASRLDLNRGTYRFTSNAPFELVDYADFTFDGHGSTLVSHRRDGAFFRLRNCERLRMKDFSLDWDWAREPLASLVRVVRVDAHSYDLQFVDYADFPNKDAMLVILSAFDPKTRSVGLEGGHTIAIDMNVAPKNRVKRSWINANTVRVESHGPVKVGELYRLQHYYYHMHGIAMDGNAHLRFENVTILSTPGHALLINGKQHHTLFSNVNIVAPKDDPRRVITCTADHLHIVRSCGFIKLDKCEFSLGADDIMNMHDCTGFARPTGSRTILAPNSWAVGTAHKGERFEFRNDDYSPAGFFGTVTSVKQVESGRNAFEVTFEETLPPCKGEGFILFNWAYDTHNVIVRNCLFHDNRARGLLILARDVTVENNVFRHHEMGSIKIETGYTHNVWSEGYGVSNVVIRGNLFDNTNPSGSNGAHRERTIYAGIYLKTDPSTDTTDYPILRDILIERNTFRDNCGVTAYLSSVHHMVVRENLIEDPTPRRREKSYRSQFYLTHVRDVRIVDNTYRRSPNVKAPGVMWDPENCRDVVTDGNRID